MDARLVLKAVGAEPRQRTHFKYLARRLGARGKQRAELRETLDQLVAKGRLIELSRGHYALPGAVSDRVAGRISLHPDGYAFVTPSRPVPGVGGDIFIPPPATADAMQDDRVLVELGRVRSDGRADGAVVRILDRAQARVVGRFHFSRQGSYVEPHDDRVRHDILIPPGDEAPASPAPQQRLGLDRASPPDTAAALDGWIVDVEVTRFPAGAQPAVGRVAEILGREDDFGIDVEIIVRKHHLPHRFPDDVVAEAAAIDSTIDADEIFRRKDFRELDIVTIDGETARDFDDAVWADKLDNGRWALQVHIADVGHYVRPGSALDREAFLRGNSVYFPDRAVPMLPAELSTEICSLKPGVDRLVISALLEFDAQGRRIGAEFHPGVIRSVERMTYTNVHGVLEGDAALRERYALLERRFQIMDELAGLLRARREKRGSIDLDLPEPEIEFDEQGRMVGVKRAERFEAHRLIEEFMLAANEAVAEHIDQRESPTLYRIHEKPDAKRVIEFEELAADFGRSLGVEMPRRKLGWTRRFRGGAKVRQRLLAADGGADVSSRNYQKLLASIEGKPEQRILSYYLLRSLKQARYSESNSGHFALAADAYAHFTSPIRRYPDLVLHRILKALLDEDVLDEAPRSPYQDRSPAGPLSDTELAEIASQTSFTERRAADAERALLNWKKARFLEQRLGDEFEAMITGVNHEGLFIELIEFYIDGRVPIDSLRTERFFYRENQRALVGERGGRTLALGDRIRVRADRAPYQSKPEFSLAERAAGPAKRKASRRGTGRKAKKK